MKSRNLVVLSLLAASVMPLSARGNELLLGSEGKSDHQLVIPNQYPTEQIEASVQRAAHLMQRAFQENAMAIEIVAEAQAGADKPGIYLGGTDFAKRNGIDFAAMQGWTYTFKAVGQDLIIAGNDAPDPIPLERRRPREAKEGGIPFYGTLKGVTEFLYQYVGGRFLFPGDQGVEFLPMPAIRVPADLNLTRRPYGQNIEVPRGDDIFLVATGLEPSPGIISNYGHYHHTAISAATHGATHPEYFVFHSRRRDSGSPHLCFSNPDVQELIYQKVLEDCDTGYDIIEMGQNDGFRPCGCDACFDLYGIHPTTKPEQGLAYLTDPAWGEKLWIMHRNMALRLEKDRPGKKLMISAYSVTRDPPATIDSFPENVIVQMMHPTPEIFAQWSRIRVPGGFAAYTYTWGSLTPKNSLRDIEELVATLLDNKVQALQINLKPRVYGLEGPNIYVFRRRMNDPAGKSAEELYDEYIEAAYREAAGLMRQFFRRFNQRLDFADSAIGYGTRNRNGLLPYNTLYTPDLMNTLDRLLTQAEGVPLSPAAKYRLAATRIEFDNLRHIAGTIDQYYAYLSQPDQVALDRVVSALEARNAWAEEITQSRKNRPTFHYLSADTLKGGGRGGIGGTEPFNWDTAAIRAGKLPGKESESKTLTVQRADRDVTLDGAVWQDVPAHVLDPNPDQTMPLKETTTFQVVYDDANLYVRFNSGMQRDLMDTFHPRGRDAELWLQESVNILLAPEGDRSQYYYLTYEPVADSLIDAQHGYITDPLHPSFGWNDQTWDGNWTYENQLLPEKNLWLSMAVIPFATLNAPVPTPGTVWPANFGRVHYKERLTSTKHADRVKGREAAIWTGRLIGSRNPGDAPMGDMIFK